MQELDFEEFFEAAMSVHQLEGRKSGEQHARRAYEFFEKDGNKPIMTGGTCKSLSKGKFWFNCLGMHPLLTDNGSLIMFS